MQRTSDGRVLTPEEQEEERLRLDAIRLAEYRAAQRRNRKRRAARRAEEEAAEP